MNKYKLNMNNIKVKQKAHYICQECGSTEMLQAHHQVPKDDSTLICLCAVCHSKKHPDVPLGLFVSKNKQPYWENKSASSLAKKYGVNSRTVIRRAKKLGLHYGILTDNEELNLMKNVHYNGQPSVYTSERTSIRINVETMARIKELARRKWWSVNKWINITLAKEANFDLKKGCVKDGEKENSNNNNKDADRSKTTY